ncbi:hypothetical protein TNCV_1141321 [Trichonephila clavipes]|nr:hypothetical protein TNCV_1141321 [Trichonephila clavipes]
MKNLKLRAVVLRKKSWTKLKQRITASVDRVDTLAHTFGWEKVCRRDVCHVSTGSHIECCDQWRNVHPDPPLNCWEEAWILGGQNAMVLQCFARSGLDSEIDFAREPYYFPLCHCL